MPTDITLTFDPKMFLKAFNQIGESVDTLNTRIEGFSKNTDKQLTKQNKKIFGLSRGFIALGATVGLLAGAIKGIPEIGQSFQIAGDILQRNLLWPLRQALIPVLQDFLNWARENRKAFVKFGQVLANAFEIVKAVVGTVIDVLKSLFETVTSAITNTFGAATRSITDLANLALVKIYAEFTFIKAALAPFAEFVKNLFQRVIEAGLAFAKGFLQGASGVLEYIKELGTELNKLIGSGNILRTVFGFLGKVIGGTFKAAIAAVTFTVKGLNDVIATFSGLTSILLAKTPEEKKQAQNRLNQLRERRATEAVKAQKDLLPKGLLDRRNVTQADLDEFGVPGITAPAVTPAGGRTTNNNVTNNNQDIVINVNGAKSPRDTANTIKDGLENARVRSGGQ